MAGDAKRTFHVRTFGCQMNVYDTERMAERLASEGWAEAESADDADLVLLNTCHIREKAAEKVYSDLGRLKAGAAARAAQGRPQTIGVTGCVAQAEGAQIVRRQPLVDLVVGPQAYHRLPDLVQRARDGAGAQVDTAFEDKFAKLAAPRAVKGPSAFVSVQEGCDKFCAFCVVPYTRGAEHSRAVAAILDEVRALADAGVREVSLLGQNVNAYHGADEAGRACSLAGLIGRVAAIEGIARVRYTTSHPNDMTDDLIEAHAAIPELMPYLHLPVQSGSDRILRAMNRKHTRDDYLRIIERVRAARPDIAISGDFIVGFPGETEGEADETVSLIREVGYAQAFSFKYSPRPGTPAATRDAQVPEAAKAERLARVQAAIAEGVTRFQRGCIGDTLGVLIEKRGREPGQMAGRSPYLQNVHLDAPEDTLGTIIPVKIKAAHANSLAGERIVA